jgi:hypothetical protein
MLVIQSKLITRLVSSGELTLATSIPESMIPI